MNWLKKLAAFFAATNMILAPVLAQAQQPQAAPLSAADQTKLTQYKDYLEPLGYELVLDEKADKALVYQKNTHQLAMEIPFGREENLRKFSPKNMNAMMLDEMVKIKDASKAAWSHSYKNLPTETAIFFMAMGAVVAGELITNYAQNPVGMKQHIDHQLSPLGVVSFFTFMYSQGVTSNVLAMYLTNPKFGRFIPYLGMVVGSFAQTYFSQIISDPNVRACGKTWLGGQITDADKAAGVDADPCSKAYDYLVVHKKIWEFAPGIVSMLASSVIAGLVETVAQRAVIRMVGVEIATLLIPGGLEVKGIRLLLTKGLQIGLFVAIDAWLSSKVIFAWKNIFDGGEFNTVNDKLVQDIFDQRKAQWKADKTAMVDDLKDFRKRSSDWRMVNLAEVYEAHQNWSEMLEQMTGMFNASYGFYNAFVNEVRDSQGGKPNRPLNMSYPMNGVKAKDLADGKEDLYFTNPKFVEPMQVDTVNDVAAYISQSLQSEAYKYFLPPELETLKKIRDLLANDDIMKKAQGLLELNKALATAAQTMYFTSEGLQELRKIYAMLGAPNPLLEPGRGFGATYEQAPTTAETLKGVNYYRVVGMYKTDHITDALVMQMVCGPDAENGENLIRNTTGFPAIFMPPQIQKPNEDLKNVCYGSGEIPTSGIYRMPVRGADGKQYTGYLDYLKSNIRPSVLGGEESVFPDWWKKTTESQVQAAFEGFGAKYDTIVANLISKIYREGNSSLNAGPMANGAITSLFQEARVYQVVLGELLKDTYQAQKNSPLPNSYFSNDKQQEPAVIYTRQQAMYGKIPLLSMLAQTPTLEFDRLIQPFTLNPNVKSLARPPRGYSLQIQKEVEQQLSVMNGLLKQIKVVTVPDQDSWWNSAKQWVGMGGHTAIQSDLENSQLEDQLKKIQETLSQFSALLGVGDNNDGALVSLNDDQRDIAVTCLESLQSLATEMMMYGTIANAVSWDKIRNLKNLNMEQEKFNNEVQKQLSKIRSLAMPGKK